MALAARPGAARAKIAAVSHRPRLRAAVASAVALLFVFGLAAGDRPGDPLARELARGWGWARTHQDSSEFWQQVRGASVSGYERADQALRDGRRLLALQRLVSARLNAEAYRFVAAHSAKVQSDTTGFAARWTGHGDSLAVWLGRPAPAGRRVSRGADPREAVAEIRPAAVRALAEMMLPQVRNFYDAALDYGYSTEPRYGLFYLGIARAQRDFFALTRELGTEDRGRAPAFRAVDAELDALHADVLAAYRPPASIDKHPEFIAISGAIKEARELNALGLHRGALLRYLQASQRFAPLRPAPAALDSAALLARLADHEQRLRGADHTIAELMLESARAEIAAAPAGTVSPVAVAIAADALPRYFAALEPAPAVAARGKAEATVTLVRWPYT